MRSVPLRQWNTRGRISWRRVIRVRRARTRLGPCVGHAKEASMIVFGSPLNRGARHAPTVSVVMAVYNAEDFLAEAIESVLGQTLTDFELLLVDDASTDG